ncbi:hypothetical protein OUZ56_008515 [Daphnia magna]|uniref:Uncharacterized protein n=1 Tax=Daphnia magna TaxID=35525 RepID=A0ABR0AD76_9CRUS|nr:hypothetical protein OUZ56_008515 [Daphnia magna]
MPCGMRVCLDATSQQRNNGQEPTKIYRHHRQHVRRQASSIQNNTTPRLLCATSAGATTGWRLLLFCLISFVGRMWVIGRFLNQVALSGIGTFCDAADYSYL